MTIFEKRKKLYNEIKEELNYSLDINEIKRYKKTFYNEPDYNIAQYGNLLISYYEVRELYNTVGLDTTNLDDDKVWENYKKDVGIVVRKIIGGKF